MSDAEDEGRLRLKCDGTRTQKPDFVFWRNGRVHLNRQGRQFSRLLAAEVCALPVVMLHTPCSEVVWRILATYSIRQFPLHFPSRASLCAITFQLHSTTVLRNIGTYLQSTRRHNPEYLPLLFRLLWLRVQTGMVTCYGDRIPVGGTRISAPVQTGPGALTDSCKMGTGSLSRG